MKFVSFKREGTGRIGLRTPRGVLDLTAAASASNLPLPSSIEGLIAAGDSGRRQAEAVREAAFDTAEPELLDEEELTFLPAVSAPQKIVCVGLNYRRHAEETGLPVPEVPVYFPKYANSLAGHREEIALPPEAEQIDYEVELAVVIGRRTKRAAVQNALDAVFGYAVANDLSARAWQMRASQWMYGKAIDGFLPLGPWLVTADAIGDPQNLQLSCFVNGERRQHSSTADMVFSVAEIVSDLSRIMTLEPGDVIITGTPEGVAMGLESKPWLQPGDNVVCEIEGLGRLENKLTVER